MTKRCPDCQGFGEDIAEGSDCEHCGGSGLVPDTHKLVELRHNGETKREESAWTAICSCGHFQECCRLKSEARREFSIHLKGSLGMCPKRLTTAQFRLLQRIQSTSIGKAEANKGRNRKTTLVLLREGWVQWNIGAALEATPAGLAVLTLATKKEGSNG